MQIAALSFRFFDGDETTGANLRGELPALDRRGGFSDVGETEHRMTPLGTLTLSARPRRRSSRGLTPPSVST